MTVVDAVQQAEQAIWRQDVTTLLNLPQADPESWAGSVQLDARTVGLSTPLPQPAAACEAERRICVIMMVKDEADIIGPNLDWLYFQGVRRFVLADNGSTDTTRDQILAFRNRNGDTEVVIIDDPLLSYIQSLKTTGMLRFALSIWPDIQWIFPVDADEFLIAAQGFAPLFQLPDRIDALTIPKVIHTRHSLSDETNGGSSLAQMSYRNPPFCVPPKSACRASLNFSISGGNHFILRLDGAAAIYKGGFGVGLYYREFQTRSFEHLLRKITNGGKAILAARQEGRAEGGDHWLYWFNKLQTEGEAALHDHYRNECVRGEDPHFVRDPFLGAPSR